MPERRKREATPCRECRLNPIIADDRRSYRRPPNGCDPQTYRTDHLAQDRALRPSLAGENLSKVRIGGYSGCIAIAVKLVPREPHGGNHEDQQSRAKHNGGQRERSGTKPAAVNHWKTAD